MTFIAVVVVSLNFWLVIAGNVVVVVVGATSLTIISSFVLSVYDFEDGILNDFHERYPHTHTHPVYKGAYTSKDGLLQYNEFHQKFA